jgi:Flp pilus assembly pilin Flp
MIARDRNLRCGTAVALSVASRRRRGAKKREDEMLSLVHKISSFRREEDGQDLLEYALLVSLIALVAVAAVTAAGVRVDAIFDAIIAQIPA